MKNKVRYVLLCAAGLWLLVTVYWQPSCVQEAELDAVLSCADHEECLARIELLKARMEYAKGRVIPHHSNLEHHNAPLLHRVGRMVKNTLGRIKNGTGDITNKSVDLEGIPKPFWPALSGNEKETLVDLLERLTEILDALHLTYFMYGGTLLGSYRHHDVIPWDDDVDIIVKQSQRGRLFGILQRMKPKYRVESAGPRLKFFNANSAPSLNPQFHWRFPYIDISFYGENKTHIWDSDKDFVDAVYPKSVIFPLHKRPFGALMLKSPFDAFAYLKLTYPNEHCQTYFYSHKLEAFTNLKRSWIKCERLNRHYGFVHRKSTSDGIEETLVHHDVTKHTIFVDEPRNVITDPYILRLL